MWEREKGVGRQQSSISPSHTSQQSGPSRLPVQNEIKCGKQSVDCSVAVVLGMMLEQPEVRALTANKKEKLMKFSSENPNAAKAMQNDNLVVTRTCKSGREPKWSWSHWHH